MFLRRYSRSSWSRCYITSKSKTGKTSEAPSGNMDLGKDTMALNTGSYQKRICYHGTIVKNMVNLGFLAKIMVSRYTILHGRGILAKILARLARNLPWILVRIPHGFKHLGIPSVRSHGTMAMIMVNLAS